VSESEETDKEDVLEVKIELGSIGAVGCQRLRKCRNWTEENFFPSRD